MPEIKIKLDNNTYEKIKNLAQEDERPVTQFVSRLLRNIAGTLTLPTINPTPYFSSSPIQPPFIPTSASSMTSSQSSPLTLEQLQEAGIQQFKLNKTLTEEEQQLQELKIQQKTNELLLQREKRWFKRAKEFMKDYWDDNQCQYFAHSHIYGDALYQSHPEDIHAITPEPDDSNLEQLLQEELDQYQQNKTDSYLYQSEIEDMEENMKDPYNEYYTAVKKYCINNDFTESLYNMLQYPSGDNLQYNHDTVIYNAMKIPKDERNWDKDIWDEFSTYFK